MSELINVTKRDGTKEPIDINKMSKVLEWASEDLEGVSASQVELNTRIQFYEGITSEDIQKTLIKTSADLITADNPNYQYMAARLAMFHLRKVAYGEFTPPTLQAHIERMIEKGLYDKDISRQYTEDELTTCDSYISHSRDMLLSYSAVKQLEGKYLVQDRTTKRVYETPQMLYMMVAMVLFMKYPKATRLAYVKKFYDAASTFKISLPTPIMAGVRTPTKQFSSCVLIECGDSLESVKATSNTIVDYISKRAGIGFNIGAIRALGAPIRNGEAVHTGVIPFLKLLQAAVKCCSQGAIRSGSATAFYPIWHLEAESLLVLKNNRGVEDNRVRQLDYGVQLNKLMYQRLIEGGNITLFSPHDVPGLYESFFRNQNAFEDLYVKYEADASIRKKTVKAVDLFTSLMNERASTGRIYIQNVDHCNTHSAFNPELAPIKQSNLCVAPETKILTDKGNLEIKGLAGKQVNVWNGKEWSLVKVEKTGENQKLLKITTSRSSVMCTPYHKFYKEDGTEIRASELVPNTELQNWVTPKGEMINDYVVSVSNVEGLHDIYCLNEPKEHKAVFNGILTGQCLEITLPTKPVLLKDDSGEVALCTLGAINLGELTDLSEMEELTDLLVRGLDALLTYQDYPNREAKRATLERRPLGIGVINFAYYLAKNGKKYSDGSSLELTHQTFEALQYYALKASANLAKEYSACPAYKDTTYYKGSLPIDTYKKAVDEIVNTPLLLDWTSLRADIDTYGLRNSTLTAMMPSETSSQIANATNGIDPPRGLVTIKSSKDGILKQVVPDIENVKYELLWDMPDNDGYLKLMAVIQKFTDQSISTNTSYDPTKFEGGRVPMSVMLGDLLKAYKYGLKTLYYHNTRDGADDTQGDIVEEESGCAGGACSI